MAKPEEAKPSKPAPLKTIGIKATAEWADWLDRLARRERMTIAVLLDRATSDYAAKIGFEDAPERARRGE